MILYAHFHNNEVNAMQIKTVLCSALLVMSANTMAQQSVLGAASQTLKSADNLNQSVQNAPATLESQAKEQVQQKINQATPAEIKQAEEAAKTLKANQEKVKDLKAKVDAAPKSTDAAAKSIESHAKHKAAEKALDLLH
jgi:hypothetical protein